MHNKKNFRNRDPKVLSFTKKAYIENNVMFIVSVQNSNLYWKLRQSFNKTIIFADRVKKYVPDSLLARFININREEQLF